MSKEYVSSYGVVRIRDGWNATPNKYEPKKFEKKTIKLHRMNARSMAKNLIKHKLR